MTNDQKHQWKTEKRRAISKLRLVDFRFTIKMEDAIKRRFFELAVKTYNSLEVVKYPHSAIDIKRQLVKSSSSAAANYRAACRAKSASDFLNKLKIV